MPGLPGFRRLAGEGVSRGSPALLGMREATGTAPDDIPFDCNILFTAPRPAGQVPIAYFSDARCLYCRRLSPVLHDMSLSQPVAITWHELPLLGPSSDIAARAALAARAQGAHYAIHQRLMGSPFAPNEAYLRTMAQEEGLDGDRLLRDMNSDAVTDQLAITAALARRFDFFGTPGLVVGRTVVLGFVSERSLERLIAAERAEEAAGPCR